MSRTPDAFGTDDNPLEAGDWSGTETKSLQISRPAQVAATLYRYLNGLDVNVDVAVSATDEQDTGFSNAEDLRGGDADDAALTVTNGGVDSDFVTEPWELLQVDVTPASQPSSGSFELRAVNQEDYRA